MKASKPQIIPRPASLDEAGLFYAQEPEKDALLGCIGHVRMDFGPSGTIFHHTWHPRGRSEWNTPEFKAELGEVVDSLRENVLQGLSAMRSYCREHGGEISGGWSQNYGYIVETERYRYCLRCNPIPGDYQAYLTCYDKQEQEMAQSGQRDEQEGQPASVEPPRQGMTKNIRADDLRHMEEKEGLILQGCGGDPQEWVDGINGLLTAEGILLDGSKFEKVSSFEHDGMTNLLFPLEGVKLDIGKLAIWRLQTHAQFGGTWLSDYVPNKLGGFEHEQKPQKPDCALIGEDGNIFNLMGIAARTLRRCGMGEEARQMQERITGGGCHSYSEALGIISEYVNITGSDDQNQGMGGMNL